MKASDKFTNCICGCRPFLKRTLNGWKAFCSGDAFCPHKDVYVEEMHYAEVEKQWNRHIKELREGEFGNG